MQAVLLVFVGAGIGGVLRHLTNLAAARLLGISFPWGTLTVNLVGSLAMGLLVGWLSARAAGDSAHLRLFIATGVLGGFTTFSSFSLDAVMLWQRGAVVDAMGYVLASVLIGLLALAVGLLMGRGFG